MGTIVFLCLLAIITIAALVFVFVSKGTYFDQVGRYDRSVTPGFSKKGVWGIIAGVFGFAFILTFVLSSTVNVTARTVGIQTEFGKATGTLQPGLHWIAPWAEVTEFPTSNQVLDLDATNDGQDHGPNVAVKFKGGGAGWVNVNITWQVQNDDKAKKLWENWKEFDAVKNNVMNPNGQSAIVEVFGRYQPEEAIDGNKLQQFNDEVAKVLSDKLAMYGISVESVAIKRVDLAPDIQDRINKQVQAQADVQKAQIEQDRARIDNETNQLRQQSLTPEALIRTCLDITNVWDIQKNGPLPANWNCTGGNLPLTLPAR